MVLSAGQAGQPRKRQETSTHAQPSNQKPGLATRQAATRLLGAVIDRAISLDGLLEPENGNATYRALPPADQALVRAILLTALRNLPVLDAAIDAMVDRKLPDGARSLRHILIVAATQILFLDIPDRAAVDLAVEQTHADPRSRRFANLANAVLRRLSREGQAVLEQVKDQAAGGPVWLVDMLQSHYGKEHARRILDAHRFAPPLDLTVKSDAAGWAERLGGIVVATGSVRLPAAHGAIPELEGFDEGAWWVQDAAASIPARLFGDIEGLAVADLCAAPGGKTAQLAAGGGKVTAFDLSANRLRRLGENMDRLGLKVETIVGDFRKTAGNRTFDAVLLDTPCSSTGTIRRHPDVPWTKSAEDVAKLASLQADLLDAAIGLVKFGGKLVFANCSLDPSEGETLVKACLAKRDDVELVAVDPTDWPGLEEAITKEGFFRTTPAMMQGDTPETSGLDGFFAAILRRR